MSEYTPGEWRTGRTDMQSYEFGSGVAFVQIYADDERGKWHLGERLPIVVAQLRADEIPLEEVWANAHIIAAACDMKAALEAVPIPSITRDPRDFLDSFFEWFQNHAQPALAKSKGKTRVFDRQKNPDQA